MCSTLAGLFSLTLGLEGPVVTVRPGQGCDPTVSLREAPRRAERRRNASLTFLTEAALRNVRKEKRPDAPHHPSASGNPPARHAGDGYFWRHYRAERGHRAWHLRTRRLSSR